MTVLLVALLVKSTVIAGLGLVLSQVLARRALDRVDVLRGTVALLLALPLLAAFGPAVRLDLLPAVEAATAQPQWIGPVAAVDGASRSGAVVTLSTGQILAVGWSLGTLAVIGRFAIGLWTLTRWTSTGRWVRDRAWIAALRRAAPAWPPRLLVSDRIREPLGWGMAPGVVLIDRATLARPDAAPAVLAHELAHLRRGDWLFLVLSRLALALFWFNPLVWSLHRALIERSEEAADAVALGQVERHTYARTLVGLAAGGASPLAAVAMAGRGPALSKRIAAIMSDTSPSARRPGAILAAVVALVAVATPLAALEIARRPLPPPAAPALPPPPAPLAAPKPPSTVARIPPAPPSPPAVDTPPAPPAPPAPEVVAEAWAQEAPAVAMPAERARHRDAMRAVRAQAEVARTQARIARAEAVEARAMARAAMRQAMRSRAEAGGSMRRGVEQMRNGAERMRREAGRLEDSAYRAHRIERARERGRTVTDAQLQALGPRLLRQADELDQQAARLAALATEG